MKIQRRIGTVSGLGMSFAMLTLLAAGAQAQQVSVDGLITGRSGPNMSVKTDDTPRLTVILSDSTKATEKGGLFGMDHKDLGITALVPGLPVHVEGTYDPDHQLIAQKITFSRSGLKTARQIDAGVNPVQVQLAVAQDQMMTDRKNIELAQQGLDANSRDIASAKQDISTNAQIANDGLSANKQAIGQTNGRIGQLDQYDTKDSITINFANGRATVNPKDRDQLTEFVKAAADTPGYMIEVQGYASTTGSAALNQKLSAERAEAVLSIIQQTGAVPLTRILAPAAMGTTDPVDDAHTRTAQAANRRVVVTIVVNKGITASSASL